MYLIKTPEGQQAFKERHADLSQRLRSAFLLLDGNRSLAQVLEATSAMGVSKDDILALLERGWLRRRRQVLWQSVQIIRLRRLWQAPHLRWLPQRLM